VGQRDFVRQMALGGPHHLSPGLWQRLHIDVFLLLLLLSLTAIGFGVLYSASGMSMKTLARQGSFFAAGYVALFAIALINPQTIKRWSPVLFLFGVFLLLLVPFFGVGAKGAQRWLPLPFFRFQPSEIMKLIVPMMVAWYLSERQLPPRFKDILVALMLIAVPAGLIVIQPDLGTSILIAASGVFVLLLAGLSWKYILAAVSLLGLSAYPVWEFGMREYQKQRVLTMLNPESDKLGAGWNIIQSKTAIGSGGLSGKGWLSGTQSQLDFLPESHTDFIIAVLAEEFGLIGVCALMLLYTLIIGRGIVIAIKAQDSYSRLLAGSITLTFFVYIFVNMGMVSGMLPVVGVPLPLVSQGGTSVVTLLMGFGVLMAISTQQKRLVH
jgi:rod shape determining protein RodA